MVVRPKSHACSFGGAHHFNRFPLCHPKWFFTKNVLAGGNRSHSLSVVLFIRRRDIDCLHTGIRERFVKIGRRV